MVRFAACFAVVLLTLFSSSLLLGHGGRVPFLFWGGYPRSVIPCQRAIGNAGRICAIGMAQLLVRCLYHDNPPCAPEQLEEERRARERKALDMINRACTDRATVQLGFLGIIEAQSDIATNCARIHRDFFRLVHFDDSPLPNTQCTAEVAHAAAKLLRVTTRNWQRIFDRVAYKNVPPSRKTLFVTQARARAASAAEKLARVVAPACSNSPEPSLHDDSLRELFSNVAQLAECVAGAAYVQDAVHCDPPATPTPASP